MVKLETSTASAADIFMEEQMRSVFQWEKSSGLEHSCYACNTKSNSPKALQTCYGIHSIPCSRYHQTMHAVGTSHNCDACTNADSLHDCRHRKIAELLAEFHSLCEPEASSCNKKNKKGSNLSFGAMPTPLRERNLNAANGPTNVNRRAPRDLESLNIENIHIHADDDEREDEDKEETENDTSTLSSTTSSSPSTSTSTAKPTKAETRANKRAAKQAKSEQKSLKNQSKHPVVVRSADVAHVHFVLHGEIASDQTGNPYQATPTTPNNAVAAYIEPLLPSLAHPATAAARPAQSASRHPLATDTAIEDVLQRNIAYVTHIKEHRAYLLSSVAGKKKADRAKRDHSNKVKHVPVTYDDDGVAVFVDPEAEEGAEDMDALVDAVLVKFGIQDTALSATRSPGVAAATPNGKRGLSSGGGGPAQARNAVLAQLRVAIADDLRKHENEQRMTCIRAGGFWRYVGKGVFERMMRVGERIDWRTGVIMREGGKGVDADGDGDGEGHAHGHGDASTDVGGEGQGGA